MQYKTVLLNPKGYSVHIYVKYVFYSFIINATLSFLTFYFLSKIVEYSLIITHNSSKFLYQFLTDIKWHVRQLKQHTNELDIRFSCFLFKRTFLNEGSLRKPKIKPEIAIQIRTQTRTRTRTRARTRTQTGTRTRSRTRSRTQTDTRTWTRTWNWTRTLTKTKKMFIAIK